MAITHTFSSYPFEVVVESTEQVTIQHQSDGFKVVFPANMWSADTRIRIDRIAFCGLMYGRAACGAYAYTIQQLSGNAPGARSTWTIWVPYSSSMDRAKDYTTFNAYKDVNGVISDFDPGAWQPAPTRGSATSNPYAMSGSFSGSYFHNTGTNYFLVCVDYNCRN